MDDPGTRRVGRAGEDLGAPDDTTSYGRTPHRCPTCGETFEGPTNRHRAARVHAKQVHRLITAKNCKKECRLRWDPVLFITTLPRKELP